MTDEALTHMRIYVYTPAQMPPAEPKAVSLCPGRRFSLDPTSADLAQVTCPDCRRFWEQLAGGV